MRARQLAPLAVAVGLLGRDAVADGALDPNFGNGGTVTTTFAGPGGTQPAIAFGAAVAPDGRIVAAGESSSIVSATSGLDIVLARYDSNGSLDSTFGALGRVATDLGAHERAIAVTVQPDGRIVAVGAASAPDDILIVRYLTSGLLDPSFGSGGVVRLTLPGLPWASAVCLEPGGKIVVAGNSAAPGPRMTVLRLQSTGALDNTFGTDGIAIVDPSGNGFGGSAHGLALQADGKVVAVGSSSAPNGLSQVAVVRLTADGAVDPSFGTGGIVGTDLVPGTDVANGVTVQSDGRIVVTGYAADTLTQAFVIRYGTDGSLDSSFGAGGVVMLALRQHNAGYAVVAQPDGGTTAAGGVGGQFLLFRLLANGDRDLSFGTNGIVQTTIGSTSSGDTAHSLLIPFPGALLAIGRTDQGPSSFGLARYTAATPVVLESFAVE